MTTILIVNGAYDWRPHFPGMRVEHVHVDRCQWIVDRGRLHVLGSHGSLSPDGVLWRLGAVRPHERHRAVLELLRMSRVPCVNDARVLLAGYDRLSMMCGLREAGLPVVEAMCVVGEGALGAFAPNLPAVLKLGNLHGGFAKAMAADEDSWRELTDVAWVHEGYAAVEPLVDYARDIRCLCIGERMWSMRRRSATWKANVATEDYALIETPGEVARLTRQAMEHVGADVLGLDILETKEGDFLVLESNDIPGILGFPGEAAQAMAQRLIRKLH